MVVSLKPLASMAFGGRAARYLLIASFGLRQPCS
jgi:hypothetical protein